MPSFRKAMKTILMISIMHSFTIDSNLVGWDILLATMIKATADIKEDGRRVNSKISHLIFFTSSRIRMV